MSKILSASIDVSKIDKSKLIKGEKGTYLNIVIMETPNSEYNTHMIKQSLTKEEREAGQEAPILGGVKRWNNEQQQPQQQTTEQEGDLPF